MSQDHRGDEQVPTGELGPGDPDRAPAYERLRQALRETGAGLAPRPGWEDRVWAAIDGGATTPRPGPGRVREAAPRWRRGVIAAGVALAAAAALLLWHPWRHAPAPPPSTGTGGGTTPVDPLVAVRIEPVRGEVQMRADGWAVGDSVSVDAPVAGASVWVYRGEDRLLLACSARALHGPACRPSGAGVAALVRLDVPATYHVVVAIGAGEAPTTYDEALAALARGDLRHQRRDLEVY